MKMKYKILSSILLLVLAFGMIVPLINLRQTQATRVKLQITWLYYWCVDSYDADDTGKFYLQFKYYNDVYYIDSTSKVKVSPSLEGKPATPALTHTLKHDFVLGANLYVRMLEYDFLNKDDLIIPGPYRDQGSGDSPYWNGIFISTSYTHGIYTLSNALDPSDTIQIMIVNLG